jgi:hypothetical protein
VAGIYKVPAVGAVLLFSSLKVGPPGDAQVARVLEKVVHHQAWWCFGFARTADLYLLGVVCARAARLARRRLLHLQKTSTEQTM